MVIRRGGLAKGVRFVFRGNLATPDCATQFGLDLLDELFASDCDGLGPTIVPRHCTHSQRRVHPLAMSHLEVCDIHETAQRAERSKVDEAIAIWRLLDLAIATVLPFRRVRTTPARTMFRSM